MKLKPSHQFKGQQIKTCDVKEGDFIFSGINGLFTINVVLKKVWLYGQQEMICLEIEKGKGIKIKDRILAFCGGYCLLIDDNEEE